MTLQHRIVGLSLSVGLATSFLAVVPAPTRAAFPGGNGKIAFSEKPTTQASDPGEIVAVNPDGGGKVNLTNSPEDDYHPSWSADGGRLAFARDDGCSPPQGSTYCGASELYVMKADGSDQVRLTNDATWTDGSPGFSPDGGSLVFASDRANPCQPATNVGDHDLYVMSLGPNASVTRLTETPGSETRPEFSPDGQMIAYGRADACWTSSVNEVFVMNSDGTGQTRLAAGSHPSWSPDGTRLAFSNPNGGISVIHRNGSNETVLTSDGREPAWSPDGTKIAFVSGREGGSDIYVMNADGSGQTRITSNQNPKRFPDWQPITGDSDPSQDCIVPKVKGKRLAAAKRAINQANCSVGKVTRRFSSAVKKGRVIRTKPGSGTTLSVGSAVKIVVSKGKRG